MTTGWLIIFIAIMILAGIKLFVEFDKVLGRIAQWVYKKWKGIE